MAPPPLHPNPHHCLMVPFEISHLQSRCLRFSCPLSGRRFLPLGFPQCCHWRQSCNIPEFPSWPLPHCHRWLLYPLNQGVLFFLRPPCHPIFQLTFLFVVFFPLADRPTVISVIYPLPCPLVSSSPPPPASLSSLMIFHIVSHSPPSQLCPHWILQQICLWSPHKFSAPLCSSSLLPHFTIKLQWPRRPPPIIPLSI